MKISERVAAVIERSAAEAVDAAVRLHIDLGPGLLESVYEVALAKVSRRAISFTYKANES
jgi:hypothetical protein